MGDKGKIANTAGLATLFENTKAAVENSKTLESQHNGALYAAVSNVYEFWQKGVNGSDEEWSEYYGFIHKIRGYQSKQKTALPAIKLFWGDDYKGAFRYATIMDYFEARDDKPASSTQILESLKEHGVEALLNTARAANKNQEGKSTKPTLSLKEVTALGERYIVPNAIADIELPSVFRDHGFQLLLSYGDGSNVKLLDVVDEAIGWSEEKTADIIQRIAFLHKTTKGPAGPFFKFATFLKASGMLKADHATSVFRNGNDGAEFYGYLSAGEKIVIRARWSPMAKIPSGEWALVATGMEMILQINMSSSEFSEATKKRERTDPAGKKSSELTMTFVDGKDVSEALVGTCISEAPVGFDKGEQAFEGVEPDWIVPVTQELLDILDPFGKDETTRYAAEKGSIELSNNEISRKIMLPGAMRQKAIGIYAGRLPRVCSGMRKAGFGNFQLGNINDIGLLLTANDGAASCEALFPFYKLK